MTEAADAWETASLAWRGGRWSLALRGAELAELRYDGTLVLRGIRAIARDPDWNTPGWRIVSSAVDDDGIALELRAEGFGCDLEATLRARPAPDAEGDAFAVAFEAVSPGGWLTSRTGLIVLHPPVLAGTELEVAHADGRRERTRLPVGISPHQPVMDIAGLSWQHDGVAVSLAFSGDVFEMEDQRNWTDASFKTYSRPLALPFPYPLAPGEQVRQDLVVRAARRRAAEVADRTERLTLSPEGRFPEIALGAATAPDPAPAPRPRGGTVLVELDLRHPTVAPALARARTAGLPLDVRLVLPSDEAAGAERDALADAAALLRDVPLRRIGVFRAHNPSVTDAAAVARVRAALADAGVTAWIVGGTRSHFTELNRLRGDVADGLDGWAFSSTPLFHDLDTAQLVEAVGMQRRTALQAVGLADGRPVHVGPVTLRPRFNDVAAGPQPAPVRADLSAGYGAQFTGADDPRQAAPELAAWTIASAAAFAVPGVASIAYFEEWGPRGIRTAHGADLPAAAAIDALAALSGGELSWGEGTRDGLVWAVASARAGGAPVVLAANLDARERAVEVEVAGATHAVRLPPAAWTRLP